MLFAGFAAKARQGRAVLAVIRRLYGTAAWLGFRYFTARPGGSAPAGAAKGLCPLESRRL